jgi:hypothetical protein
MGMTYESMTTAQGPSQASPEQLATAKAMLADLMRQNLTKRRFADGGEASNFTSGASDKKGAPAKKEKEPEAPGFFDIMDYSAKASTKMFPKQTGADDQRDAARHMLAAALVTKKLGPGMAEFLGKAHERMSNPMSFFNMIGIGEPRYDYPVDVHNNKLGIDLASKSKSQGELEKLVEALSKTSSNEQQPGRPWTVAPEVVQAIMAKQKKMAETPPEYRADGSPEEGEGYVKPSNPFGKQAANQARQRAEIAERSRIAEAREKVARTPALDEAGGETTDEFIQRTMGFDPSVNEQRGTFLPQRIKRNGKTEFIAPNIVKDALLPYNLSSQALTTGRFDPSQVPEAAMNTSLASLAIGKAPAGSLGMAVRTPGGSWRRNVNAVDPATHENVSGRPSQISQYITGVLDRVPSNRPDVKDFIVDKLFPYLTKTFGTDQDPIRKAILEGKVKDTTPVRYGGQPVFRNYLLEPAREAQATQAKIAATEPRIQELRQAVQDASDRGLRAESESAADQLKALQRTLPYTDSEKRAFNAKSEALVDFHNAFDKKTGISAKIISDPLDGTQYIDPSPRARDLLSQRLTAAGVPLEHQNIPAVDDIKLTDYAQSLFPRNPELQHQFVTRVRAGDPEYQDVVDSIRHGEPILDLSNSWGPDLEGFQVNQLGSLLAEIPADRLKKMSAAEAYNTAFPNWKLQRQFGEILENIKQGRAYPKDVVNDILEKGLKPIKDESVKGWYQVATPQAVQIEGAQMKHSVGGYATNESYNKGGKPAFMAGTTRVYSLRPNKTKPEVTMDVYDDPETGKAVIHTIYGVENHFPTAQKEQIFKFFDTLPNLDRSRLPSVYYSRMPEGQEPVFNWQRAYSEARPQQNVQQLQSPALSPSQLEAMGLGEINPEMMAQIQADRAARIAARDPERQARIEARRRARENEPGNEAQMAARQRIRDRIAARNARAQAEEGIPPAAGAEFDQYIGQLMQEVVQNLRQNPHGDFEGIPPPAPAPAAPQNGVVGEDGVLRLGGRGNFPLRRPNE